MKARYDPSRCHRVLAFEVLFHGSIDGARRLSNKISFHVFACNLKRMMSIW